MQDRSQWLPIAAAERPFFAGVDLGGTNIKAGLVDNRGRTLAFHTEPTHAARGPEDAAARMGRAVKTLCEQLGIGTDDLPRVGLGTPGPQDLRTGVIIKAGNLPGWDRFPIRDRVAFHCGRKVTYSNDANAAAYGEYWVGGAQNCQSLVLLTLGTGVGGGIIVEDLSIDGAHSHGSECGHMLVDPTENARLCPCGQRGHLEAYASATSLKALAREALTRATAGSLFQAVAAGEELTPILISREAAAGDPLAMELILEAGRWLGIGVVSLMHTIDPEIVLIGGAMTFGGEQAAVGRAFIERIRGEVRSRTFPLLAEKTQIRFASLGGDAGYIGAAGLARAAERHRAS